jgi:hypothetical protein
MNDIERKSEGLCLEVDAEKEEVVTSELLFEQLIFCGWRRLSKRNLSRQSLIAERS